MSEIRKNNKKRILAVDDAAIILQRITNTLEEYYSVITVNSGVRALKFLEIEKPDLILLDIRMAPKDGFETLREIRSMEGRADIPVIMLTGVEDSSFVMEGSYIHYQTEYPNTTLRYKLSNFTNGTHRPATGQGGQ